MQGWQPLWLVAAAILVSLAMLSCSEPADPDDFSVVLVTLDTTRADRIGYYGSERVPTPHLDDVGQQGVGFENAISQVPLTLPAHSSILTGRYPASHGVRHNGIFMLRDSEETLAERLSESGFETAAFLAAYVLNSGFGLDQGFDVYDDIPQHRFQGGQEQTEEGQRTAAEVNARVFDWLDRRDPGRFFLWVHYYDPHAPYSAPETPGRTLHGAGYDREISYTDACFGDLMTRLSNDGLLDRSIVVVVGDHGESLGEHREKTHGIFLYRGAMNVPLFMRAPGLLPSGKRVEGPAEIVDIAPTVLDYLGMPALEGAQGRSLRAQIESRWRRIDRLAFAETLMPRLEFGWSELRMVQDGRFKYIEAPRPELYDLVEDPAEEENLVGLEVGRAARMASVLADWVAETTVDTEGAARTLTPEEEAKLTALGYLGGDAFMFGEDDGGVRPDPKDRIDEGRIVWEARDLLAAGRPDEAIDRLDGVLAANPANQLARTTRLQALIRERRVREAEEEALALLALAEMDPDGGTRLAERARRTLASVYWMLGEKEEAREQHRLARELARENRSRPVFASLLLGAVGGLKDADSVIDYVLARDPRDGIALSARFELELGRGDQAAALETATALAEVSEAEDFSMLKAASLLQKSGRSRAAVACYEYVVARAAPHVDLLGHLATARIAAGDLRGAEVALEKALELAPDDPEVHFFLGNVAVLRGDERQARARYDQALALDPTWAAPLVNLARFLADDGRLDEAEEALVDALKRSPGDAEAEEILRVVRDARRQYGKKSS